MSLTSIRHKWYVKELLKQNPDKYKTEEMRDELFQRFPWKSEGDKYNIKEIYVKEMMSDMCKDFLMIKDFLMRLVKIR